MKSYYLLSEQRGLAVIDADAVDESDPARVRFLAGSKASAFERHDLLWWSPVEAQAGDSVSGSGTLTRGHVSHGTAARHRLPLPREPDSPALLGARQSPEFFRRSETAHRVLHALILSSMPPHWKKAELELTVRFDPVARRYHVTHRIHNPDTGEAALDFSDVLFAAIEVFHRIDAEAGQNWDRSTVTITVDERKHWRARMNFTYDGDFGLR